MSPGEEIRLGLRLQYDGSGFFGWQAQKQERTVQGELETAVERLTGERRSVLGAGRTDRGVHASGQVAAVNVPARWSAAEFRKAANAVLPRDIWVEEARRVHAGFHPRYEAISRTYFYHIGVAEEAWSPFRRPWCWPLRGSVDWALLDAAAALIPGNRSFAAFAKAGQPERGDQPASARRARGSVARAECGSRDLSPCTTSRAFSEPSGLPARSVAQRRPRT